MGIQPTNAGIDFQQRISAWFMIGMMFDIELDTILNVSLKQTISTINFESKDKIDDLVIKTADNHKLYLQMKRNINFSTNIDSDFYSVCKQFVMQHIQNNYNDKAYILVTSSFSSGTILETLRRLLECIRTAQSLQITRELNKIENDILEKVTNVIKSIYFTETEQIMSDDSIFKLLNKMYVEIFDIEEGQSYEKTVKIFLYSKTNVDVDIFWHTLITFALNMASNRQTLSKAYLLEKLEVYIKKDKNESIQTNEEKLLNFIHSNDSFSIKMDYILTLENAQLNEMFNVREKIGHGNILYLLELYRFDDNGKRKLKFEEPNLLTLNNGIKLELVYRSATHKGIERFVSSEEFDKKYSGYNLLYIKANGNDEGKHFEEIHMEYLKNKLTQKTEAKCLICGNAIFQEEIFICEIDNVNCEKDIGIIHKECILPINRVLGIAIIPAEVDYSFLKNFDVNLWIKKIREGQYCFGGIGILSQPITQMVVETDNNFALGKYCVRTLLEDGTYRYTTRRAHIDRFTKLEAEQFANNLNECFQKAKAENNPFCYSSKSFTYGDYNNLVKMIGGKEEYLQCRTSEVIYYNASVASMYNKCDSFYAPLIYLSVDDEPLIFNKCFPMFTNPLELKSYLDNWKRAGIDICNYQINIIKDDNEFSLKVISLINQDIRPIVNMKIDLNKEPIQAIIILTMQEIEIAHQIREMIDKKSPQEKSVSDEIISE